jgi:hypothetical protein
MSDETTGTEGASSEAPSNGPDEHEPTGDQHQPEHEPEQAQSRVVYSTRHEANVAFFKLSQDEQDASQVIEDPDTGRYYIGPRGG